MPNPAARRCRHPAARPAIARPGRRLNAADDLLGENALSRHGERIALICGAERITYRQLAERVGRAAAVFSALGVAPGQPVLLLMRDTTEFAAAWLGAVRAGAIAIALNNRLSEREYRHILADSKPRLALIEDVFAEVRPDLVEELARERRVAIAGCAYSGCPDWRQLTAGTNGAAAAVDVAPEAPAFALYSSGTTGMPKGILHSHRSMGCAGGSFRAFGIGESDRILSTSKFFFAYGLEHGLLAPLGVGATSILFADWPDSKAVLEAVEQNQPSAFFSVPTLYRRLLAEPGERLAGLRPVRRFVAAGERLSPQLVQSWRALTGGELLSLYGMSETFCACMVTPPGTSDGVRTGLPLPGVEVRLASEGDAEPACGTPGVLWVRHPAQAAGYLNLEAKTREQFRDGWFCTRDLFIRDSAGFFVHQGRADDLVKIAGQWVQPGEIEDAAVAMDGVAEAACVALTDADGLQRLALFVTGEPLVEHDVLAACERSLPRYKRPKWIRIVNELPRTATGKVQRYKLRELLERELAAKD